MSDNSTPKPNPEKSKPNVIVIIILVAIGAVSVIGMLNSLFNLNLF